MLPRLTFSSWRVSAAMSCDMRQAGASEGKASSQVLEHMRSMSPGAGGLAVYSKSSYVYSGCHAFLPGPGYASHGYAILTPSSATPSMVMQRWRLQGLS